MSSLLKYRSLIIKALISVLIIGVLAARMNSGELKNMAGQVYLGAWGFALLLLFAQILALSWRWELLINVNGRKMDYIDSLRVTLASLLANYLFITSIGGIVVRVALAMQHGVSFVKSVAATTLDRVMTMAALLVLGAIFLPVLYAAVERGVFLHTLTAIGVFAGALVALPFLLFKNVRRSLIFANRRVAVGFKYLRSVATNPDLIAKVTAASLLGQVFYFAAVYAITISTGVHFPLLYFMAVLPMIALVASLPVGYGGWGIREGAFVYGLGLIHVPIETAFIVSVQIGLLSMFAALLAGIPALASGKSRFALKDWKSFKAR